MGRKREKNYPTIHHILGKSSCKDWAWVEDETNKTILNVFEHQALNTLFKENQCPHKQLEVMYKIWETSLSEHAKELIKTLLSLPKEKFYNSDLLKKGK